MLAFSRTSIDVLDLLLKFFFSNLTKERPLITCDFRVGRGFKMTPKIGRFRVEKGK